MPIEPSARIAFLKKIHLFYGLDDEHLAAVAEELDELQVAKGEIIFKQDGPAEGFYMIFGGRVRVVRKQDGKETQLALLVKNDYFGELAIVSNRRRSATVTALEDTSLLILSRDDFNKLFREHHDLKGNLEVAVRSRQLARQLRFKWLRPDEVVLGGGNAKLLKELPPHCRVGANANAFVGGLRMWEAAKDRSRST